MKEKEAFPSWTILNPPDFEKIGYAVDAPKENVIARFVDFQEFLEAHSKVPKSIERKLIRIDRLIHRFRPVKELHEGEELLRGLVYYYLPAMLATGEKRSRAKRSKRFEERIEDLERDHDIIVTSLELLDGWSKNPDKEGMGLTFRAFVGSLLTLEKFLKIDRFTGTSTTPGISLSEVLLDLRKSTDEAYAQEKRTLAHLLEDTKRGSRRGERSALQRKSQLMFFRKIKTVCSASEYSIYKLVAQLCVDFGPKSTIKKKMNRIKVQIHEDIRKERRVGREESG
ncbi:MAG: hypothetical protein WBD36_05295 [Bacteroidota bacterium]